MPRFIYIYALGLALLLLQGCKAPSVSTDALRSVHRDSVAVHIRDTFHNRSIFDSLSLSLISHDTIFRVERIIKEITNAGARARDTSFVSRRDTVVVHQTSRPAARDFSWLRLGLLWFAGVIVLIIVGHIWRYPR